MSLSQTVLCWKRGKGYTVEQLGSTVTGTRLCRDSSSHRDTCRQKVRNVVLAGLSGVSPKTPLS